MHETFFEREQNHGNEAKNKNQTILQTDTETRLAPQIYETQSPTKTSMEEKLDTNINPKMQTVSKKVHYLKQNFFGIGIFTFHRIGICYVFPKRFFIVVMIICYFRIFLCSHTI